MPHTRTPACPKCHSAAAWIRSIPAKPGFVAHSYECPKCLFVQVVVEPDPIKQAEGWVKSELKPPER